MKREFRDLFPIDLSYIEAKPYPTFRAYVGRQVKSRGVGMSEVHVISRQYLATHGNNAIAVMVVKVIGKVLFPYQKATVLAVAILRRLRQR